MIEGHIGDAGVFENLLKRSHKIAVVVNQRGRLLTATLAALVCDAAAGPAFAETRSLNLYFVHTKERATITFKRNGRYIPGGLKKLNRFLRDWRRKESTKMDPRLFDLLWEVYRDSGSKKHIHVVSAYRSPKTNAMLRKRSRGVAKNSQHIQGRAMDFYLPDVSIKKLRRIGMQFQVGGVGYYPKSGSPFVHLDVGSVRSWPRMNRNELSKVFPKGKTLHLPTDGKPLPGYNQALADYKSRVSAKSIQVAGKRPRRSSSGGGGGLLAALFGRNEDSDQPVQRPAKAETQVASVAIRQEPAAAAAEPELAYVPTPQSRPAPPDYGVQIALASVSGLLIPATPAVYNPRRPGGLIPESGGVALNIPQQRQASNPVTVATLSNTAAAATTNLAESSSKTGGRLIPVPQLRTGTADYAGTRVALAPTRNNPPPEIVLGALLSAPVMAKPADTPLTKDEWNRGKETPGAEGSHGGPQLAFVPRPAQRPDVISPEAQVLAGVFEKNNTERLTGEPAIGIPIPTPSPFSTARSETLSPLQVALAPTSDGFFASDRLGIDMFSTSTALPRTKGARPSAQDAASDRQASVRAEPVLTENMIARRAFSAHTLSTMGAAVTAPQFVSSYMRTAPETVHVNGFSTDNRIASARQFSGRAVNFMTVARFETLSR
ncbi:MAG: DUF882 domain-containing protein [Hyphomicrobiales bacterium]|nr:DUF882 domain-containing protein [Hyphomicrobiales bacterium]